MEITQFALGVLSVVFLLVAIIAVMGLLKAHTTRNEFKKFEGSVFRMLDDSSRTIGFKFDDVNREMRDRLSNSERHLAEHLKYMEESLKSYTDSRIDKSISGKKDKKVSALNS